MPAFERYIGIDYSGAMTAESSLAGLRVYWADAQAPPREVPPTTGPKKYWTRRALAAWLLERLEEPAATLVGVDHGFSFPLAYFKRHKLARNWDAFLDDFDHHWPTAAELTYVDFVRDGLRGSGAERKGSRKWRRVVEVRCGAKSVFHFDVPGSVAKSTHAGIPWLLRLRRALGPRLHCWPYDGWKVEAGRHAMAEVYPTLCRPGFPAPGLTGDQQDAYAVCGWLRQRDRDGTLDLYLEPELTAEEREAARVEGWILGVA